MKLRKLLLFADFPDKVLWDRSENGRPVEPEGLGLSDKTCGLLREWYRVWSQIWMVDKDDKTSEKIDWLIYDQQGLEVWKHVRSELPGRAQVIFYSHVFEQDFEDPEALESLLRNRSVAR